MSSQSIFFQKFENMEWITFCLCKNVKSKFVLVTQIKSVRRFGLLHIAEQICRDR